MGWPGAIRTIGAIARAVERDARRRARDQARQLALVAKAEQQERAIEVVNQFEEFVSSLTSAHRACSPAIDWVQRAAVQPPSKPKRHTTHEQQARRAFEEYRPSLLTRMFGRARRARLRLAEEIRRSRSADEAEYRGALKSYEQQLTEHDDANELARRILDHDRGAMLEFLNASNPFGSVAILGESLKISIHDGARVSVELNVHSEEVIPKEVPRLLNSGRLSLKPMARGDYYRLYQDHVCSAVLRVAAEILAALPVDTVVITAVDDLLDHSTGHVTKTPILSVMIPRATIAGLNIAAADPSDSMRHFGHRMDFKPTAGFRRIIPIAWTGPLAG